jgi:radical SAM/Cys-rich protein
MTTVSFAETLTAHDLALEREEVTTLQVNVGLMCNQRCAHCHLDAGPERKEIMSSETMDQVVRFAASHNFEVIDITGGAPELHPDLPAFIEKLYPMRAKIMLRSNLSVLAGKGEPLMEHLRNHGVHIVASFPSLNEAQTEAIRGKGIFKKSVATLRKLNDMGYGIPGSDLRLDLVVNPAGAFLPSSQKSLEKQFKKILEDKWKVHFNQLFSFANVPLGRYKAWLQRSNNYERYMDKLTSAFNPSAVEGLMCRSLISVSWDGFLYDCDFNQASGLYMGNRKRHISEIKKLPSHGEPVAAGNHCFTCTAGEGFT